MLSQKTRNAPKGSANFCAFCESIIILIQNPSTMKTRNKRLSQKTRNTRKVLRISSHSARALFFQEIHFSPPQHAYPKSKHHDNGPQPKKINERKFISLKSKILHQCIRFLHSKLCFFAIYFL